MLKLPSPSGRLLVALHLVKEPVPQKKYQNNPSSFGGVLATSCRHRPEPPGSAGLSSTDPKRADRAQPFKNVTRGWTVERHWECNRIPIVVVAAVGKCESQNLGAICKLGGKVCFWTFPPGAFSMRKNQLPFRETHARREDGGARGQSL